MTKRISLPIVAPLVLLFAGLLLTGCSRTWYRKQADKDVYRIVKERSQNPHWPLIDYTIQVDRRSRMFDPYNPDQSPMPPDDPASFRLSECISSPIATKRRLRNGMRRVVESPDWYRFLPVNDDGELVLDLTGAIEVAYVNSPDYQSELEELYLSALDVTFERFRFETQFFGGYEAFFTANGPDRFGEGGESSSILDLSLPNSNRLRATKMFAAGGEAVVGLANSLVWQFSGPNEYSANTVLDFSIVQPLLRGAGRLRVQERLTIAERTLLANVRQLERFRRGFYADLAVGRGGVPGPQRRGGFFGGAGLEGFSGVGSGGFGRVGGFGGIGGGGAGAAQAGGYLGLLQDVQEIRNLEANVDALRESLLQLQAFQIEGGRIDPFQVELTRQALYNAQSQLLTRKAALESSLDSFKIDLGLPPSLDLVLDDPMLDRFNLIDPDLSEVRDDLSLVIDRVRPAILGDAPPPPAEELADLRELTRKLAEEAAKQLGAVRADYDRLLEVLPDRRESLQRLAERPEAIAGDIDPIALSIEELNERVTILTDDFDKLAPRLTETLESLNGLSEGDVELPPAQYQEAIARELVELAAQLLELSLIQARARLDSTMLLPIELTPQEAFWIASQCRRDWMNARASLVDAWRLIDFNANDLRSGLDIVFSGDIRNQGDRPFNLDSDTGQLRVGLQFDAPLTRLAERNVYRQSLIEYQQARRRYYTFVDNVNQSLRNTLRTMRLNDLNFELRRAAVYVAIRQVELARLELQRPPRPGEVSELNNTAGRDLIDAFRDLLNAQNDFLSVWVNYEVQRVNLDLDLGTMELDRRGIWIDPGAEIGYTCPTCPPYPGCLGKCRRGCARCNPGGEVEHLPEPLPAGDDVEAFPDDVELLPVPPPAREAPDPVELPEVPVGPRIPDPIVEDETVEAAGG